MESVGDLLEQHGAWVLFGGVLTEQPRVTVPFPALPWRVVCWWGPATLPGRVR